MNQFSSVAQSCPTLCDPMNHSTPGLPVHHQLPEFLQTHVHRVGEDRDPLKGESFLRLFDVLGQDGETGDGKPLFHVPVGSNQDLLPQTESLPAAVRIRNKDYLIVFTPSFREFGQKRVPPEPRHAEIAPSTPAPIPPSRNSVDKLIQLLIKKGVLTEEEWRKANQP